MYCICYHKVWSLGKHIHLFSSCTNKDLVFSDKHQWVFPLAVHMKIKDESLVQKSLHSQMLGGWSVHSLEISRRWITYLVHPARIELVGSIEDVKWLGNCWLFCLDNNLFFDSSLCSQLVLFRAFCSFKSQHADKKINVHAIFWSFSPFITANAQALG